jgi:hypothetical protein
MSFAFDFLFNFLKNLFFLDVLSNTTSTTTQLKYPLSLSNRLAVDAISGAQQAINVAMGGYDVEKVRFLYTHVLSS